MSKIKTTMTYITNAFSKIYRCGYCDLQNIYAYSDPQYYNSGIYGWNCDIYIDYTRDIAITTGYRNMRGVNIPSDLIEKYSAIAKEIRKKSFSVPFDTIKMELEANKQAFLTELAKI